jgi:RNA-dependent RNA polymerase
MDYDRNFEFEGFEKYIDKWRGLLQRYNKEMNGASKGRQNEILVKYQKVRAFQANIVMQLSFQLEFLVVVGSCCVLNCSNCGMCMVCSL